MEDSLNKANRETIIEGLRKLCDVAGWGDICAMAAALLEADGRALDTLIDYIDASARATIQATELIRSGIGCMVDLADNSKKAAGAAIDLKFGGFDGGGVYAQSDH